MPSVRQDQGIVAGAGSVINRVELLTPSRSRQPNYLTRLTPSSADTLVKAAWLEHEGLNSATTEDLQRSLEALEDHWPQFLVEAEEAGWDVTDVVIRYHCGTCPPPPPPPPFVYMSIDIHRANIPSISRL